MRTAIIPSSKENYEQYLKAKPKKSALIKRVEPSQTVVVNQVVNRPVNSQVQTYTFVGIAG